MGIESYSTTPASNTALFPENMALSDINDKARQVQADIRSWYEDPGWTNLGHTPTRTGNTTFTISGDKTTDYTVGRRIKCTDSSTIYGTIVSSSYSAPNTTVTIHSDSGNLSASLTAVAVSGSKPTNVAIHANLGRKGSDIASASTVDLSTATGDFVDVTGTTTITALGTMAAGVNRVIRFTGALTLTHNATSLILPSGASITTANGDIAAFRSLGSGNWVCASYSKANGGTVAGGVTSVATSGLATGGAITSTGTITVTAATQSDQETGSSTSVAVTPGIQKYHPSAAKVWALFDSSGGLGMSFGVSSVTQNGAGDWTVNFSTSFSGNNYCTLVTTEEVGTDLRIGYIAARNTGSVRIEAENLGGTAANTVITVACFGDL